MRSHKFLELIIFFIFISATIHAQDSKENWVAVDIETKSGFYINVTGLSNFTGDDIYVWTLAETKEPIEIDGVDGDIYKTKTYYLINKSLKRYSILQVMYFDDDNNVLKSYTYNHDSDNPDFKYGMPIMKDSDMEKVLLKCFEFIPAVGGSTN